MALAQAAALLELGKPALQRAAQGNVELVNGLFDSELRMAVIAALAPDGTLRECPGASDRAAVSRWEGPASCHAPAAVRHAVYAASSAAPCSLTGCTAGLFAAG